MPIGSCAAFDARCTECHGHVCAWRGVAINLNRAIALKDRVVLKHGMEKLRLRG